MVLRSILKKFSFFLNMVRNKILLIEKTINSGMDFIFEHGHISKFQW